MVETNIDNYSDIFYPISQTNIITIKMSGSVATVGCYNYPATGRVTEKKQPMYSEEYKKLKRKKW